MTDRINAITVVLAKDIRDDDARSIIDAIQMIKGVLTTTPNVASLADHTAYMRARADITDRLWAVIYPPKEKQ